MFKICGQPASPNEGAGLRYDRYEMNHDRHMRGWVGLALPLGLRWRWRGGWLARVLAPALALARAPAGAGASGIRLCT